MLNKAIIMGRLTRDPEIRYSQAAEPVAVARYTLACDRNFKREGEPDVDFIPCVAFRRDAEFAEKYFKKGMLVAVSGRIRISEFDDRQTGQRRLYTEIVIDEQNFGESRASFEGRQNASGGQQGYGNQQNYGNQQPRQAAKPDANPAPSFSPIDSLEEEDLPF